MMEKTLLLGVLGLILGFLAGISGKPWALGLVMGIMALLLWGV